MHKTKKFFFYLVLIFVPTLLLFGIGEIVSRAFFPQFKNQVTNENYTVGKRHHTGKIFGFPVRLPTSETSLKLKPKDKVILVFGDSISGGYGHAYEDIYWRRWQRTLELEYDNPPTVVSINAMGNNFNDNFEQIEAALSRFRAENITILGIVYQYNFNDIAPYTKQDLLNLEHLEVTHRDWWNKMMRFRLNYLNRSVLQRVLSHYVARIFRSKSEDCEERGVSALGSITWSYGAVPFSKEAEELWLDFEKKLLEVKKKASNLPFFILLSPIMPDIDSENIHEETFAKNNYLWPCATIEPRKKLQKISARVGATLVDPTKYIKKHFLSRVKEGNPERFFLVSDDNHFNSITSAYLADFSYFAIIKKILHEDL